MMHTQSQRRWFLHTALSYLGTPYIWGGDDPSGFDCSGFVQECLKSAGIWPNNKDATAQELVTYFKSKEIASPHEGAVLFTMNENSLATHVVICLDEYFQIGASGGRSSTIFAQIAWDTNAYIKIRKIELPPGKFALVDPFAP
ncbi:MAG: NlpC/P60 family protein [candidate division Zixibacteria bacterium]|nr:NlpC/P60 family protein [candidate division Zixibacteria bacterium]